MNETQKQLTLNDIGRTKQISTGSIRHG